MAPHERSGMSLRWEFVPDLGGTDRAVRWRWRAHTQSGKLFAESREAFETLSECVGDARQHGYHPPAE
jgi:hypothetical protein